MRCSATVGTGGAQQPGPAPRTASAHVCSSSGHSSRYSPPATLTLRFPVGPATPASPAPPCEAAGRCSPPVRLSRPATPSDGARAFSGRLPIGRPRYARATPRTPESLRSRTPNRQVEVRELEGACRAGQVQQGVRAELCRDTELSSAPRTVPWRRFGFRAERGAGLASWTDVDRPVLRHGIPHSREYAGWSRRHRAQGLPDPPHPGRPGNGPSTPTGQSVQNPAPAHMRPLDPAVPLNLLVGATGFEKGVG